MRSVGSEEKNEAQSKVENHAPEIGQGARDGWSGQVRDLDRWESCFRFALVRRASLSTVVALQVLIGLVGLVGLIAQVVRCVRSGSLSTRPNGWNGQLRYYELLLVQEALNRGRVYVVGPHCSREDRQLHSVSII